MPEAGIKPRAPKSASGKPPSAVLVALSEGDHQDLAQLGFLPEHPKNVVQRCLRYIFLQDGRVAYGGNLSDTGITFDVVRACVQAYSGRLMDGGQSPFVHVIAEYLWRNSLDEGPDDLFNHFCKLCSYAEIWLTFADDPTRKIVARPYSNASGKEVELRESQGSPKRVKNQAELNAALPPAPQGLSQAASLTSMRRLMAQHCNLWISTGGKYSGYSGARPGIAEEAIYAIQAGKPVFPLAAFGGCARDIAHALGLLAGDGPTPGRPLTQDYSDSIADIRTLRDRWRALLSDDCEAAAKVLANAENPDQAETALHAVFQSCLIPPAKI